MASVHSENSFFCCTEYSEDGTWEYRASIYFDISAQISQFFFANYNTDKIHHGKYSVSFFIVLVDKRTD